MVSSKGKISPSTSCSKSKKCWIGHLKYIRSICRREVSTASCCVCGCTCGAAGGARVSIYLAPCFASSVTQPFLWGVFGTCLDLPTGMYLHRASPPVFTHYDQLTVFALEIATLSLIHTLAWLCSPSNDQTVSKFLTGSHHYRYGATLCPDLPMFFDRPKCPVPTVWLHSIRNQVNCTYQLTVYGRSIQHLRLCNLLCWWLCLSW